MIGHKYNQTQAGWKKILMVDFLMPILIATGLGLWLDRAFARSVIQYIIDIPGIGVRIYHSPFLPWYLHWHRLIFLAPVYFFMCGISFRTARIPGPGRAVLRWYQSLLQLKVRRENPGSIFPAKFIRGGKEHQAWSKKLQPLQVTDVLLGMRMRFESDREQDVQAGRLCEPPGHAFPIVMSEKLRFRHIQIVAGTGMGKSASLIAPLLQNDALYRRIATVTVNPKGDQYLLQVLATGLIKGKRLNPTVMFPPTAIISFSRKDSLAYDPLLYGDADALTKKIMGSSEIDHPHYRAFQETWLLAFFRVMLSEEALVERLMLRHLYQALIDPLYLTKVLAPLCKHTRNARRLTLLAGVKPDSLSGLASHIGQFVEDDSLSHIFNNPKGRMLNVKEVIEQGGNIFFDLDSSSKGPQARALGRMILMELQLLAGARQNGLADKKVAVQVHLDEFASFAYPGFINLLDKCRSARMGILLAHQSLGNLQRANLPVSFKDEVVDNTHTKFFLAIKDATAQWASEVLGSRKVIKKSLSIGHATEKTGTGAKETRTETFREEMEPYVEPSGFNLALGQGYCMIEDDAGKLVVGPMSVGFVDEKSLCSDAELLAFLKAAVLDHPFRPRGGSLIDNGIPPLPTDRTLPDVPDLTTNETNLKEPSDPNPGPSSRNGNEDMGPGRKQGGESEDEIDPDILE
jgi:hypothetical protein